MADERLDWELELDSLRAEQSLASTPDWDAIREEDCDSLEDLARDVDEGPSWMLLTFECARRTTHDAVRQWVNEYVQDALKNENRHVPCRQDIATLRLLVPKWNGLCDRFDELTEEDFNAGWCDISASAEWPSRTGTPWGLAAHGADIPVRTPDHSWTDHNG